MTKVLVTGSAGFIGGYVVEELLDAATTWSASTTTRSTGRSAVLRRPPRLPLVEGDARDVDLMTELLDGLRPLHRRRGA